jgi:phenylalanyl-tRNA synthetase beta chain
MSFPKIKACEIAPDRMRQVRGEVRNLLLSQGFHEAITYAMTNRRDLEKTQTNAVAAVKVKNPLTLDQEVMRPALAQSLLSVVASNLNRGQKDVRLFETGKIYSRSNEKETLGIIAVGRQRDDWREPGVRPVDFYDIKGAVESVLKSQGITNYVFQPAQAPLFKAGWSAQVMCGGKEIGWLGHVSQSVLDAWAIKEQGVVFAQMDLEWLGDRPDATTKFQPPSEYPAIVLDISLAVNESVSFQQVQDIVNEMRPDFLSDMRFKEQYMGEKIPKGQRGVVFSLVYQSTSQTLREADVSAIHEQICQALLTRLGAVRR